MYIYIEARKIISHEAAGGISGAGMINALERACRIITHLQRPRRVVLTRCRAPPPFLSSPYYDTKISKRASTIPDDRLSILSLNCPRTRGALPVPLPPSSRFCIITHGCAQTRMHA